MISSKTIDLSILSNYKSSTYTNTVGVIENFSDLRQYIGSEYCLIGGERNRSPLVEDNGMIKYDNSNSYATTNEWIPIGNLKVTRVTLKYQKPYTSNTSWYKFSIFLSKLSDTDNEVYTSVVVNDTSTQSQTWYEVDVDFNNIEVNYFKVNAIVGRVFIKDIVIYYQDDDPKGGGAGSGYIGNSLLSNKKMVGYNVPTSSAEGTKTESVNDASASAVSGKPKSGNGFARIKLISTSQDYNFTDIIKTLDMTHIKHTSGNISNLSEYYLTDWILNSGINSQQTLTYNDGVFAISDGGGIVSYPITRLNGVSKVTFKARRTNHSVSFDGCFFNVIDGVRTVVGSFSGSLNTDWKTFTVNIDNKIVDYFEVYAGGGYGDNVQISDVVFTSV